MSSRALQIVTQLSNAPEQTMTSQELAERIGVSAHTIKNEMPQVAQILNENGARLVSRRHKGYYVEVLDPEAYDTFSAVTSIRQMPGSMLNADRESRVRYLSRRIISTETGIKKEQLADQLFLSTSALREPLSMATRLCESFGLRIVSRPGTGMRVEGEEYKRRLALTEVSGVHFHKETLDCSDPDSASWLSCGYEERQDIRHTFLKILRESPISLRDSATQRVAVYLIIARNRVQNGHEIRLPDPWLESISGTMFYPLAQSIYHTLEEQYGDYAMPRDEVAFLGILLFSMLDVNLKRDPFSLHPGFAGQAGRLRDRVLVYLKQETGLDFALLPMARDLLQQILFNLIAQHFYGMDGAMQYDYVYELQFLDCPLCAELSRRVIEFIQTVYPFRANRFLLAMLSCYFFSLLHEIRYPIRPLRLCSTHFLGTEYARIQTEGLKERYPELIEEITPMNLYELRRIDPAECDGVLLGNGAEQEEGIKPGYRYDYPVELLLLIRNERDFDRVYNTLLVEAYQYRQQLPPPENYRVIRNFQYYTPEQFFQYLAGVHGRDEAERQALLNRWIIREKCWTYQCGEVVVVFQEEQGAEGEEIRLEFYPLEKRALWGERKIRALLYVGGGLHDWQKMKALNTLLYSFVRYPEELEAFAEDPPRMAAEWLRRSLQTM